MNRSRTRIRRRGFTFVQLLVVCAIIAVLIAFFLPAVQRSREAARRTQCKNNLKQFGLALHNYHDTNQMFPPGFVVGTDGVYQGWGWGIGIMPYLDCSPYYNRVNFSSGLQNEYNKPHMNPIVHAYRCPTDPGFPLVEHVSVVSNNVTGGIVIAATADAVKMFSRSNYFGNAGYLQAAFGGIQNSFSGEPQVSEPHINAGSLGNKGDTFSPDYRYCDQGNFGGIFGQNSSVKLSLIKDGASNVFLAGERYTPKNASIGSVGHGTWLGVPDCTTAAGLAMALADTSVKLNSGYSTLAQTTGFGSMHVGGSHFLMCDGSVRFVSQIINIKTYRDLSTIDDGNEIGDF